MFLNQMNIAAGDIVSKYLQSLKGLQDFAFVLVGAAIAILVLVVFFFALASARSSRTRQLWQRLRHVTAYIKATEEISEENLADFNRELKVLPEDIRLGWGNFLDRQVGYPSEYMSEPEILKERSYQQKSRAGSIFFHLFAWIIIFLGVGISATIAKYGFLNDAGLFSKAESTIDLLLYVLSAIYIPLIAYAILSVILRSVYKKQSKKTMLAYRAFKDALDEKVSIFREEAVETNDFYQDNQEEINSAIEEIVANKIGHTEIMEIVTVPRIMDVAVESMTSEPTPTPMAAVVAPPKPKTVPVQVEQEQPKPKAAPIQVEQEQQETAATADDEDASQLEVLKGLVRNAIKDPNATEEDLEDLQHYIMQAKIAGFKKPQDQLVLADCIDKLNAYMIVVQGKPSELTALLYVIDNAVNDKDVTKDDLIDLRSLIVSAKESGKFQEKKDQKILLECVGMLNNLYKA